MFAGSVWILAKAMQEFSSNKINPDGVGLTIGAMGGLIVAMGAVGAVSKKFGVEI